ncbi:hypothetical protein [Hymenobacter chitinivorans]|uniref:Lipoprotein n=1 Tax=Hymenobacter chitinivorans DSM 11115 TaxID=1121954 RepID=A0A2M9BSY4_9BACT|nr:hypothetical protein [Hymenobacter chitinivorans]PJJ61041.1 hypothetical protein CLV45_2478 [Hymenobacter chitinivorans DSM 11115]
MTKFSYLPLAAVLLLLAGCNQTPPATEQSAPAETAATPTTPEAAPAADTATAPAAAPATPAAAPAASTTQNLTISFAFKPGAAGPDRKTAAHLVVKGAKNQDIDLGQFSGKPDVVDKEKAKLAGFPGDMLMGFRSYDPGSGTSYDLAVMNVGGNTLRIVQRKVEEQADKAPEFQTSREVPLPANSVVQVAPAKK